MEILEHQVNVMLKLYLKVLQRSTNRITHIPGIFMVQSRKQD